MKWIAARDSGYVPASHEDPRSPGVLKRVIATRDLFQEGRVQMLNWALLPAGLLTALWLPPSGVLVNQQLLERSFLLTPNVIVQDWRPTSAADLLPEVQADIAAMIATSAALSVSGIPFNGPIGAARVGYVNGQYVPHGQATVHIEDRGFQFSDGVYEVWSVFDGRLADFDGHMTRLHRSLNELRIDIPMSVAALTRVLRETIRRNRVKNGIVYLQVTRGTARRDHPFPAPGTPPSVIVTAKSISPARGEAQAKKGVAVLTQPDIRWGRCDIKTVGLLPNVLAKQAAREAGSAEAWFIDADGLVTASERIKHSSRLKNGQLTYLDHGSLGLLIKVTPQ